MLYLSLLLCICITVFYFFYRRKIYIKTSSMAIIMAIGISIQGVSSSFIDFNTTLENVFIVILLSIWFSFLFSFIMSIFTNKFIDIHYKNFINRFGMGTWVAGTSVCGILIYTHFSELSYLSHIILYLNICLWFLYILISLRTLFQLVRNQVLSNVNGILLLTTVSTQSIVLLLNTVYENTPKLISSLLIGVGLCFYIIGTFFIIWRYIRLPWSIQKDWHNTNCILHGALSITGLACFFSNADYHIVDFLWLSAFIMFLLIEIMEIFRLISRVKNIGIKAGILTYNVSQWSRIFTFAMFYTLTYKKYSPSSPFHLVEHFILALGGWIIIALILVELSLCLEQIYRNFGESPVRSRKTDISNV